MSDRGHHHAEPDEVPRIVAALDTLLEAIQQHDAERCDEPFRMLNATDLGAMSPIEALLADPIRKSYRLAIRLAGERLHQLGGTQLMREVLDQAAGLDPDNYTRRAGKLGRAWNCIGGGGDVWVA